MLPRCTSKEPGPDTQVLPARGQHNGRPKALDKSKAALALHACGESASTIATALSVSRATVYRVLAEQIAEGD